MSTMLSDAQLATPVIVGLVHVTLTYRMGYRAYTFCGERVQVRPDDETRAVTCMDCLLKRSDFEQNG